MAGWSDFTVITGGAAAALVGLLFVAVTLRIDELSRAPDLRSRAAQTLTLFAVALVVAIVLAVPDQPEWVLGAELTAIAVLGGAILLALNSRAQKVSTKIRLPS
jgi:Na+/H+ antiporter NhaD/arsenite permease-like protein